MPWCKGEAFCHTQKHVCAVDSQKTHTTYIYIQRDLRLSGTVYIRSFPSHYLACLSTGQCLSGCKTVQNLIIEWRKRTYRQGTWTTHLCKSFLSCYLRHITNVWMAVPWPRQLGACLSSQRSGFNPAHRHARFVMVKAVLSPSNSVFPISKHSTDAHTHSFIYHKHYLSNDTVIYSVITTYISNQHYKPGDMFRFTGPSSGQFLKQSTLSECAHYGIP
jgi:hypothetical protein